MTESLRIYPRSAQKAQPEKNTQSDERINVEGLKYCENVCVLGTTIYDRETGEYLYE